MSKIKYLAVLVAVVLIGCASTPEPTREDEAVAAARSATAAMDGGGASRPGISASVTVKKGKEPAWVSSPDAVYDRNSYVAVVGYGADRNQAEKDALGRLVAVFGQSVQADIRTVTNYSEAVSQGTIKFAAEDTTMQNAIEISAGMDSLIGAEIKDIWYDNKKTYYAVAVLEKGKASRLYTEMIQSNERIIQELIALSPEEKQSLDGFSRYQLAATIADVNRVYANVLSIVGGSRVVLGKDGDAYRLEGMNITKSIPIGLRVKDDRFNRIKDAFASALAKQGFRSGGTDSRYVLQVQVIFSPVELPNQQNKFVRYSIEANLVDTYDASVLLPFNINGREGHLSVSEAENRAVVAAEKKITDTYGATLATYLSGLLPNTK